MVMGSCCRAERKAVVLSGLALGFTASAVGGECEGEGNVARMLMMMGVKGSVMRGWFLVFD